MLVKEVVFNGLGQQVKTGKMVDVKDAPMFNYIYGTPYQGIGEMYVFDGKLGKIRSMEQDSDGNSVDEFEQKKGKYNRAFVVLGAFSFNYSSTYDFPVVKKDGENIMKSGNDVVFESMPKNTTRAHIFGFWVKVTDKGFDFEPNTQKQICLLAIKSLGASDFEKAKKEFIKTHAMNAKNTRMVLLPYSQGEKMNNNSFFSLRFEVGAANPNNCPIIPQILEFEKEVGEFFSLGELIKMNAQHEFFPTYSRFGICSIPDNVAMTLQAARPTFIQLSEGGVVFKNSTALKEAIENHFSIEALVTRELPEALDSFEMDTPALPSVSGDYPDLSDVETPW